MVSRIHPTVPSPPHTKIRQSGTSLKNLSLRQKVREKMRKDSKTKATKLLERQITSFLHIWSPSPLSKDFFPLRAEKNYNEESYSHSSVVREKMVSPSFENGDEAETTEVGIPSDPSKSSILNSGFLGSPSPLLPTCILSCSLTPHTNTVWYNP